MRDAPPVLATEFFPELNARLIELLRGLSDAEWRMPTVCEGWSVKELAAHLRAEELGNLSRRRDGFVATSLLRASGDLTRHPHVTLEGDRELAVKALDTVSIIA